MNNNTEIERGLEALGLKPILERDAVQRLKRIRFLGTMQYIVNSIQPSSRYDHTMAVTALSLVIAQGVELPHEYLRRVALLALLHDIGHSAFSHGSEIFIRGRSSQLHEDHTLMVCGLLSSDLERTKHTELASEVQWVKRVLGTRLSSQIPKLDRLARSIVKTRIGADALDGITRAARSIGLDYPDPMLIAGRFFRLDHDLGIDLGEDSLVRDFLNLDRVMYEDYVYSDRGIAAEAMLTRALELSFPHPLPLPNFLRMNDDEVENYCVVNSRSRELFQRLRNRDFLTSLRRLAPSRHAEITAVARQAFEETSDEAGVQTMLERHIAKSLQLGSERSFLVISHYTTKRVIPKPDMPLPGSRVSVKVLAGRARMPDAQILEIFVPPETTEDEATSIPRPDIADLRPPTREQESEVWRQPTSVVKALGSHKTPIKLADFLTDWAIRSRADTILDPAAGDGVFLEAAFQRLVSLGATHDDAANNIYGVEADWRLCDKSAKRLQSAVAFPISHVLNKDFFTISASDKTGCSIPKVDIVVGNPPYVGFHLFSGQDRERALSMANAAGIHLPQTTSSWAPYVVHAVEFLKPDGRLAMVLPSELLTIQYARQVREHLEKRFRRLLFVVFESRVFAAQQDVVLLLADSHGQLERRCIRVKGADELIQISTRPELLSRTPSSWLNGRWTSMLVNQEVLDLFEKLRSDGGIVRLGDVADIRIGIVTGDNSFFIMDDTKARRLGIRSKWLRPILANTRETRFAICKKSDLARNRSKPSVQDVTLRRLLLRIPPDADVSQDAALQAYLEEGSRAGVDRRYKCSIRYPWYSVPWVSPPDAFLTYMFGKQARMILNESGVSSTNTIHNVSFRRQTESPASHIAAFYNSLTSLSIELVGRAYGGGMLKLEPSDCKDILIPSFEICESRTSRPISSLLDEIDRRMREGESNVVIDDFILKDILGLGRKEQQLIRDELDRLRGRRHTLSQSRIPKMPPDGESAGESESKG